MMNSPLYLESMKNPTLEKVFHDFWRCVTLCHDIIIFKYNDKDHFSGSSQDEIVMIEAAKQTGFSTFLARDSDGMTIQVSHGQETYRIIKIFAFTSARKMMTIVVKNTNTGKTIAFVKGADSTVLDKVTDKNVSDAAFKETLDISRKGYRTLCYAMKELDPKKKTSLLKKLSPT